MNSTVNILVMDDNELIRETVCLLLSSLDYLPTPPQDATEAFDCMNNNDSLQLVLTDINMPQMDGWELALHIKDLRPDMPIVALTGEAPNVILPQSSLAAELIIPFLNQLNLSIIGTYSANTVVAVQYRFNLAIETVPGGK